MNEARKSTLLIAAATAAMMAAPGARWHATDLADSRCQLRALVYSRGGTVSPF
jgi:hypothetical protein